MQFDTTDGGKKIDGLRHFKVHVSIPIDLITRRLLIKLFFFAPHKLIIGKVSP